jgi:hypothetical protein
MSHASRLPSAVLLLVCSMLLITARSKGNSKTDSTKSEPPFAEIDLRKLGYEPAKESRYSGTGIPRDLSVLNDDSKKRLAYIGDDMLAIYFSHLPKFDHPAELASFSMEALFVNPSSGSLISRRIWPTHKRKWLNDRWDTQARIIALHDSFLVHAGDSLTLYSTDQHEKASVPLENTYRWAAVVSVLGHTVHLQRIKEDNSTEGSWLASDSLKQLKTQPEAAGIISASDSAVVTDLAHCVQLQAVGKSSRDLCCFDPCRLGLPEFLSEKEIVSVYANGFIVLSDQGEKLWGRETPIAGNGIVANHVRSLEGNRFAIVISSERNIVFDDVKIAKGHPTIVVYDRSSRERIMAVAVGSTEQPVELALSENGDVLAVLVGDVVRLYRVSP